ncbi:hypothetical protein [Nocardioides jensenii]|uniref:hypothetical protein n=1 Tax=Nocardioides jensenii TaxID=1843 RepID=UPI00082B199D|nr:hypothetical protein [Nocardioides jensenii]
MHKRTIGVVAASVAALVLIGGTSAEARGLITGKNVKDSSLTGADIKDSTLTGRDVKNGTLTLADLKASDRAKLLRAPLNTTIVESPIVTVPAYDSGVVIAFCPAGKRVTGGGYFSSIAIAASSSPGKTSWGVVINNFANDIPVEVNAYAVCV